MMMWTNAQWEAHWKAKGVWVDPACPVCRDTGLTYDAGSLATRGHYCTCKAGKNRKEREDPRPGPKIRTGADRCPDHTDPDDPCTCPPDVCPPAKPEEKLPATSSWDEATLVKARARDRWGDAWRFLSREQRLGAVSLEIIRRLAENAELRVSQVADLALGAVE